MGHIINATAFRLGKTKSTSSIWIKKNTQYKFFFFKDYLISRFIKNFFITYNIPVFSFSRIRVKKTGNDDIYPNPWITNGFVFSNCVITRNNSLNIHSFFLDSILEEIRTKAIYSVKGFSYFNFPKYKKRNWAYNPFDYFYKNKNKFRKKYKNQKKRFYKRTKFQYLKRKLFFHHKRVKYLIRRINKRIKYFIRRKNQRRAEMSYWKYKKIYFFRSKYLRSEEIFLENYSEDSNIKNYTIDSILSLLKNNSKNAIIKNYTSKDSLKNYIGKIGINLIKEKKTKIWKRKFTSYSLRIISFSNKIKKKRI